MSKQENHVGRKLAAGALIAGVAGYVAGVLTAPKSGKQTRKDISDTADKAKIEAEKKIQELRKELDALVVKGKTKATDLNATARTELAAVLEKAQKAKDKSRQVVDSVRSGEADDPELDKAIAELRDSIEHLSKFLKK